MKNPQLTLIFATILLFTFSCKEKPQPFSEFESLEYGAFPRLINDVQGLFDYDYHDNSDTSFIQFEVEFYDEDQGKNVESYSWDISYENFGPVQIASKSTADFVINADGFPSTSFYFTFSEIFNALGMTKDDITTDGIFIMNATLKRTDGKVFTFSNTGSNIVGQPTFQGFFRYTPELINLPCQSDLAGIFKASASSFMSPLPITCDTWESQIKWEGGYDTSDKVGLYKPFSDYGDPYDFQFDYSFGFEPACLGFIITLPFETMRIKDDCGVLSFSEITQFGAVYLFTKVEPNGDELTIKWENDYGEGSTTILKRTDGRNWPDNLTCDGC